MSTATHYRVIEDVRDAVRGRMLFSKRLADGRTLLCGFQFVEIKAGING